MKNPINISNMRGPLKGILLLLMLFIISNLFISSISQFYIINREIDNIGKYYRSIGLIYPAGDNYYIDQAQEIISGDKMIDFEDKRRHTIGFIDGFYNIHKTMSRARIDYLGSDTLDTIFTAKQEKVHKSLSADSIYEGTVLITHIKERFAGFPTFIVEGSRHDLMFSSHSFKDGEKIEYINDNVIDKLFELEPGRTFLFRTYHTVELPEIASMVKPLYDGGPLYLELDENGSVDWNDSSLDKLKEDIDFINQNIISYHVIGTKDMTALPAVQDSMKDYHLIEGRWIDKEDNKNQNNVAVLNDVMARINDINIGDEIEITMRDSEYGEEFLATEKDRKEWKTYHSETIPFEVVGIFRSNLIPDALYRDIYVPDSVIPQEFGSNNKDTSETKNIRPYLYSHMYSFVLKNLEDESVFMKKYRHQLSELDYELSFVTNNGESFLKSANSIKRSSLISFVLFSILLMLTQIFVVHIYVDGHIVNYAIERILGISSKISGLHLILPLIFYGTTATVMGGYLGCNNAIKKSRVLLSDLPQDIQTTINSSLDIKYFILFLVMSIIPFIVIGVLKIGKLKKLSVIDLINNYAKRKNKFNFNEHEEPSINYQPVEISNVQIELNKQLTLNDSKKALRRFSVNHTLRSKVPSMLLILLAGIFVFSLLWMNYLMIRNNNLIDMTYKEIIITGDIEVIDTGSPNKIVNGLGPINGRHINNLFKTELVQDYTAIADMDYGELHIFRDGIKRKYEPGEKDKIHFIIKEPVFRVYASNKPYNVDDRSIRLTDLKMIDGYSIEDFNKEYIVDYTEHFNPKILNDRGIEEIPVLVSNKAMEHFDLELGDKILLDPEKYYRSLLIESYGTIVGTFKEIIKDRTLHGYIIPPNEVELFIYPIKALQAMERELHYNKLEFEFKPEKNKQLIAQKEEIKKIVSNHELNVYPTELKLWDEELINVVDPLEKNLSLLEVLYPVTFIVSILITGILSFLMVLRRTMDVAILRILGVKEKEVRWNLLRENFTLTVLGIVVASLLAFSITINTYPIPYEKYIYVIGGYIIGTIVGLVWAIHKVTNKKPLDLLQVKE